MLIRPVMQTAYSPKTILPRNNAAQNTSHPNFKSTGKYTDLSRFGFSWSDADNMDFKDVVEEAKNYDDGLDKLHGLRILKLTKATCSGGSYKDYRYLTDRIDNEFVDAAIDLCNKFKRPMINFSEFMDYKPRY